MPGPSDAQPAGPEPADLISVIAPAHNESGALAELVDGVTRALAGEPHEIVIVDDGSSDGTWDKVRDLRRAHPQVRGVRFTRNFGHQAAILAGLMSARGRAVIMMDSDGQHPPELLPKLIETWRNGALVVQGVRTGSDGGVLKRWTSRLFYRAISATAGVKVPEGSADFRLIGRPVVDTILRSTGALLFLRGLIPWLGYDVVHLPFKAGQRVAGRPSYTWSRMIRLSLDGLMSFSIIPLRLCILLGVGLSALSFMYLIYILFVFLFSSRVIPGWASVAGLLALLGGIQLLMIGVLGEYLGKLFLSNLNRPPFVVREQL
jgi:dolichol-phosphate mannosyltransferase